MVIFGRNKKLKDDLQKLKAKYSGVRQREAQTKNELARLNEVEKEHELVDKLLKEYQIINVQYNKDDEKQYVCLSYSGDNISMYLRNLYIRRPHPRLFAEIYRDINGKYKECKIIDVFAEGENSGNGSLLLQNLLIHLKKQDVWQVKGELSSVDKDRFDKLEHFYRKNGFKVTFDEKRTSGKITLTL